MVVEASQEGMKIADQLMEGQSSNSSVLSDLEKQREELVQSVKELKTKLRDVHECQDEVEAKVGSFSKAMKELGSSEERNTEEAKSLYTDLHNFQQMMPITGGPFVELFLGKMNVRFPRRKERLQFKKEYELFKQKLSVVFAFLAIISLFINQRWVHMGLQLLLSYYYVTLGIRENILRGNGSNIKSWWIQHHYLMVCCGVVLMTWPPGKPYSQFAPILHLFGIYTSVLQIFQTRYQMARLYTRLALGKAGEMDIVNSETTQIDTAGGSMNMLLPMILFGHCFQLVLSIKALRIFLSYPQELQPLLVSGFNLAMFAGNFLTTMRILVEKAKSRSAARRSVSKSNSSADTGTEESKKSL